jgi:hypothetical protein
MAEAAEEFGMAGGFGGEEAGVRGNAGAPEVEAVGIPAGADGGVGVDEAAGVAVAGFGEGIEIGGGEVEEGAVEGTDIFGGAGAVVTVATIVFAAAVVKEGEEEDEEGVGGRGLFADEEAALGDAAPVVRAVDGTGFMGAVVEDTEEEGVEIGDGWGEGHQVFRVAQTGREGGGGGAGAGSAISGIGIRYLNRRLTERW